MPDEHLHYPPGAAPTPSPEPEKPNPETPAPEPQPDAPTPPETPAPAAPEEDKGEKPENGEGETPKPGGGDEPEQHLSNKPRSIYDDYKDLKKEKKTTETELAEERRLRSEAETRATELQKLLEERGEAVTPAEKAAVDDEIAAFAEKNGLQAEQLTGLVALLEGRITKNLPKAPTLPEGLTSEDVKAFREQQAQLRRQQEDAAVLAEAPNIKKELGIADDAELAKVMAEVVRLSHTKELHDKEVGYIVWKHRDTLSKMVSPKRKSFEPGGNAIPNEPPAEVDFSDPNKLTPAQMQDEVQRGSLPSYEIRRSS